MSSGPHTHVGKAIDPVCGMEIDAEGLLSVEHRRITYWFCDPACEAIFRDEPERWAAATPLQHDHDCAGDARHA
jgi:YHS domain-containing protein